MAAPAPLQARAVALEAFTEALFDCHQRQNGLKPRWVTVKEATRAHWRQAIAAAADQAWRSQYSPLAGERLINAPDPYRVLAMSLALHLGAGRSRARTPRGLQRAVRAAGGHAFGAWQEAIDAGAMAVCFSRGDAAGGRKSMLLEALPDLRRAA